VQQRLIEPWKKPKHKEDAWSNSDQTQPAITPYTRGWQG